MIRVELAGKNAVEKNIRAGPVVNIVGVIGVAGIPARFEKNKRRGGVREREREGEKEDAEKFHNAPPLKTMFVPITSQLKNVVEPEPTETLAVPKKFMPLIVVAGFKL